MKKEAVAGPKKRVWKGVLFILFGLVIIGIPLYRPIKIYYHLMNGCRCDAYGDVCYCPRPDKLEMANCPSNKPYVLPSEKKYSYYRLYLEDLEYLVSFSSLRKEEIPDFEFADVCDAYPEPGCERLEEIKKEQQAILEWNQSPIVLSVEAQNREIGLKNDEIRRKNVEIIEQAKNDHQVNYMLKFLDFFPYGHVSSWDDPLISPMYSIPFKDTPLHSVLYDYLDEVEEIMSRNKFDVEERMKENAQIVIKNEEIKKKNQEIIQKNEQALQTAKEYWTVEKKKELLDDYGNFIKNNCVDCNYTGRIPASSKEACKNSCPNRKYENGYCVLK